MEGLRGCMEAHTRFDSSCLTHFGLFIKKKNWPIITLKLLNLCVIRRNCDIIVVLGEIIVDKGVSDTSK